MKRCVLLIVIAVFSVVITQAQYVTLPDTNFVRYLKTLADSQCFNGYQLDTTCSVVLNMGTLNCGGNVFGIKNIDGVQYFKNLDTLQCAGDFLENILHLPPKLKILECQQSTLTALPALPATLKILTCDGNSIAILPALPDSLMTLTCSSNQLTILPPLPNTLLNLICWGNNLTALPELPDSMGSLDCSYNSNLFCFPQLKKINYLRFNSTGITCLPDSGEVTTSNPSLNSLPLCDSGNTHGCAFFTAGINPIAENDFSFNPNPALNFISGTIHRIGNDLWVKIISIDGQVIIQPKRIDEHFELNISSLSAGVYFIQIQDGRQNLVRKFIKE